MFSNQDPWAATQACSRLGTAPTARASCLWNNWFHLLQLSAMPWARRWCLSSGLCRPSALAHYTRRSPEAWGPDSLVTRPPAWWRPGRPTLEAIWYRMNWFYCFCKNLSSWPWHHVNMFFDQWTFNMPYVQNGKKTHHHVIQHRFSELGNIHFITTSHE